MNTVFTAKAQRTQSSLIVFVDEFLCVLCAFAVSCFIDALTKYRGQTTG